MKRPPGLWILLSAGVLWLSLQDVYGIRATALIFGRSTTTTTEATSSVSSNQTEEETATDSAALNSNNTDTSNSTNPTLTGVPQVDYIYDPNLPKELNGYNLSEYPFYERVPAEEIDFKCDGLHDGFYASVPHKCQVYHHCLFGTRYDFLCANYTAFDQKTFICQFVSEVDCQNSKKFWHRNDALYQAQSTTTLAPVNLKAAIYTTAPPDGGSPVTPLPGTLRRPAGGARRPYRPRRPAFDYYEDEYYDDEYYDDRPRANRGHKRRPRPRPRPVYDDDYDEYEDERYLGIVRKIHITRSAKLAKKAKCYKYQSCFLGYSLYESRRSNGRRRPSRRKNKNKRRPEYDENDEEVDDRFEDEDFIPERKRQKNPERGKRPLDEQEEEEEERSHKRPNEKRRPVPDERDQQADFDRKPVRKGFNGRRPTYDAYDEIPQSDDSRNYEERPRKNQKHSNNNKEEPTHPDGRPIIKPTTGTIYDRPRVAPRINLPVPKNAAGKYAYKSIGGEQVTTTTTLPLASSEEEYEDEEYEEPLPKRSGNRRPSSEEKREDSKYSDSQNQPSDSSERTKKTDIDQSSQKNTPKPKYGSFRNRHRTAPNIKRRPPDSQEHDEEYSDVEKEIQGKRPSPRSEKKNSTISIATTTTTAAPTVTDIPRKEKHDPVMRIIKRPFLPSRGGNPYSARGLQPIGLKAVDKNMPTNESQEKISEEKEEDDYIEESSARETLRKSNKDTPTLGEENKNTRKPLFKASPVLIKVPVHPQLNPPIGEAQELIASEPSHQQTYKTRDYVGSRTTQKKNPLDLNEYDVTLNDALNPTLPNLPIRAFPTGFSSASNYNSYSRPRYVLESIVNSPNQNYVYPNKVVRSQQRYEAIPQGQYTTINAGYRQQQGQTQALYSGY